jgi:hypothetical protein
MVLEKNMRFQGKNIDLDRLSQRIVDQVQADGYKTQSIKAPIGNIVQARKEGLRDLFAADRAFMIVISGQPNDFTVRIGIQKWVQNLSVTAVEALFSGGLFLVVDVPEMLWTVHVEHGLANEITELVNEQQPQQQQQQPQQQPAQK